MDGQGDTQADIAGVEDRHPTQPPLFRTEREHRRSHGEGDGGVRRRPAPENPAAHPAEAEDMTDVRADAVRRMDAARERFVSGRNQRTEQCRLPNSPTGQNGSGTFPSKPDEFFGTRPVLFLAIGGCAWRLGGDGGFRWWQIGFRAW